MGAYARTNGGVVPAKAAQFLPGPYRLANVACEVHAVLTNKTPTGTYRGPGRFEANFFRERMLDLVAADLGLDPVALRMKNLLTPGERELKEKVGEFHVGLAGPPCQGHSDLNNHTRRDDEKNDLYPRIARFVELTRPRYVLVENVAADFS